ncbi:MAG TPA: DHA2 family efflux MFS transporter permease subunit [Vitreimonas sp.]|jgi:DHA2 family multidrug resistance protein|nr:DHA2 family efflux MFS transporter permease subunit [Vitreimonas sp.]
MATDITASSARTPPAAPVLEGAMLILAGFVLSMANFMAVLDTSIANVALPHIAGSLAASPKEGTSVITFFAVAEAITIPLTGWLGQRFGNVRVFLTSMAAFGVTSALCGLASSLPMLIIARILQGLAAGPMMPLSQALLTQIVPKKHYPMAIGLWTMTVIIAPIVGPVLGGNIADSIGWEWAFYINVPVAIFAVVFGARLLPQFESQTVKKPIDFLGLALLVTWVCALQMMLDFGDQYDWFSSGFILSLLAIGVVGFVVFVIWELTEEHPIVDLRIFGNRGFATAVTVITITFGVFFSSMVLIPLWLQTNLNYTATSAGNLTAFNGMLGLVVSPIVARMMQRFDPRWIATIGLTGLAVVFGERMFFTSQMSFAQMVPVQLMQGAFMPLFFIPLMALALGGIAQKDLANASGLLTFSRTLAGAVAASVVTTAWSNEAVHMRGEILNGMQNSGDTVSTMQSMGMSHQQALQSLDGLVQSQAVMLATDRLFAFVAPAVLFSIILVWLSPAVKPGSAPGGGGH